MHMKIAVVNETSAGHRNPDVMKALETALAGQGHTIINAGMKQQGGDPELSYIETGFLAALLLNTGRADFIVGSCGTGQGFVNVALQYPGVFCGLITEPTDAFLFARINGGNCISLPLNKGYGWAGDVNLQFIFEKLFTAGSGAGYPESRVEAQAKSRELLKEMSTQTHLPFKDILNSMDQGVLARTLTFPGVWEILDVDTLEDAQLKAILIEKYNNAKA